MVFGAFFPEAVVFQYFLGRMFFWLFTACLGSSGGAGLSTRIKERNGYGQYRDKD
jgi:hypothetical protein